MIITGLAALSKFDMKKIIALLTLSQLGVIFSGIWGGVLRCVHLIRHAYFKAIYIYVGWGYNS